MEDKFCGIVIDGKVYTEKADAGQALIDRCKQMQSPDPVHIGEYRGFKMTLGFDVTSREYIIKLKGAASHELPLGSDALGNITRLDNRIDKISEILEMQRQVLDSLKEQTEVAKAEVEKPFEQEAELTADVERLNELNVLIKEVDEQAEENMEQSDPDIEEDVCEDEYDYEYEATYDDELER